MLDDGRYGSVSEMATAKKLDRGYLGRILMLTLLAPDIVQAILLTVTLSHFTPIHPAHPLMWYNVSHPWRPGTAASTLILNQQR